MKNKASGDNIVESFWQSYSKTPKLMRIIDVFLVFIMLTGALQFAYCIIIGTFPFNAFLAGFISTLGTFVLFGE